MKEEVGEGLTCRIYRELGIVVVVAVAVGGPIARRER